MSVKPYFPLGHYHSPIVDPDERVRRHLAKSNVLKPGDILGIDIDIEPMKRLWEQHHAVIDATKFSAAPERGQRFSLSGPFPYGDGLSLRLMMAAANPRRVIEVGSGFSTACMLDCADELGLTNMHITCIEPYPDRLLGLLRPTDFNRITLLRQFVQDVSPEIVSELQANDILFIDSTHVMKTGSDLHFEFFEMLPRLQPGTLVHFHDCRFPFEYPLDWVADRNYSWNETYALRAFLTFNKRFSIVFWGSAFRRFAPEKIEEHPALKTENPGTSIWLRVNP